MDCRLTAISLFIFLYCNHFVIVTRNEAPQAAHAVIGIAAGSVTAAGRTGRMDEVFFIIMLL